MIRSILLLMVAVATVVYADDYSDARSDLIAAYQSQDYAAMVTAAENSLRARPEYPGAMFNLSLAQALNGNAEASLDTLQALLEKRVDFGVDTIDEFAIVRDLPAWRAYAKAVESLYTPAGDADIVVQLDEDRFVPEGIAIGADGDVYLGSIHKGQLLQAKTEVGILSDREGHWSVFGMRFHDDGSLWFASAAVPQFADVGGDEGKTGLFQFDLALGKIVRSAVLSQHEETQVLGDLIIVGDFIFTTDSLTGAVYRYDIGNGTYDTLVERGTFGSPQGLVLDTSGGFLYVADYIGGLYRVAVEDGSMTRLAVDDAITDYGIDGLYRYGNELIAIQNGIRPHRVVAFELSDDGLAISGSRILASNLDEFDEPTLGTVRGDYFYFVANSHWNRFDPENRLPDGLSGPIVLRIPLKGE